MQQVCTGFFVPLFKINWTVGENTNSLHSLLLKDNRLTCHHSFLPSYVLPTAHPHSSARAGLIGAFRHWGKSNDCGKAQASQSHCPPLKVLGRALT